MKLNLTEQYLVITIVALLLTEYFQNMFFFLILREKRQVQVFNKKSSWDVSSSVREFFNGYNIIRHNLRRKEQKDFTPIKCYESVPIPCFFTDKIHLADRRYLGKVKKKNEIARH